jgi:type I restriction enzyme S subunit
LISTWEQRKFGEITELKSASRVHKDEWTSNGVPFYRSSDVMAAINGTENEKAFISEELYEKLSKVSGKLEEGDILVTGGGSVGNPYIVTNNKPLYTKDADLLWIKNKGKFHPYFLYEFFFSPTFRNYLGSISHVGTIAHYTITQLSDTPICLPSFDEQKEVGEYFQSLDNLITLHQRKLEHVKKMKKSMLQKMFPKKNQLYPEVRFPGFTDAWEQRKLGEVCQEFKSGTSLKADQIDTAGDYPVYGGNGLRGYTSDYNHDGEFALIGRQGALCGNMNYSVGKAYFTEHAVVVDADINNDIKFLYYMLDTMNLGQYSDQSAQPGLAVNKLVKLENLFPTKEEQRRIGRYFSNIDHLITLHQRESIFAFILKNITHL